MQTLVNPSKFGPTSSKTMKNAIGALATAAAIFASGGLTPASALGDSGRDSNAITGWSYYTGVDLATVQGTINAGRRLVTLKVESANPLRFNVTTVNNSGEYAEGGWWWYYNATAQDVSNLLAQNNGRLISLSSYDAGGGVRRFAIVMVRNTGSSAKTWWWYTSRSQAEISNLLSQNNARLVDLHSDDIGGTRVYHAVMVRRSGADNIGWGWHVNADSTTISNWIDNTGQRLIDLQVVDDNPLRFNAVYEQRQGQGWWWWFGQTFQQLEDKPSQYAARVFDQQRYSTASGDRFAFLMLDNANDLTLRTRNILLNQDGRFGFFLKEVGGSTLASLNADDVFEPASTIKALHHVHAMRQVQNGAISLNSNITVFSGYSGSCPQDTGSFVEPLQTTLQRMMENSDNARTQAVRVRFGEANINATAAALGMTNSELNHRIGCGGEAIANPNDLTPRDIAELYEDVAQGYLSGSTRDTFWNLMLGGTGNVARVENIIIAEANAAGLSATERAAFLNATRQYWKGGNYGLCSGGCVFHRGEGGYLRLPFKQFAQIVNREYVYGVFINDATNDNQAATAIGSASVEIHRDAIREAIATWACPADYNGSGQADFFDYLDFVEFYEANDRRADFNGDGQVDFFDYLDFSNAFSQGCD
ncbi:MAG: serine hydrolase [Planctomycetota bacterium]|nr:serine hydrolase [Planctomycetota bacterium]